MDKKLSTEDVFGSAAPLTQLVDELVEMFPNRTPTPLDSHAKLMYEAGQRSVLDYIIDKKNNV
jgi:hypothetical protein